MRQDKSLWIFSGVALLILGALIGGAAWRQGWFLPQVEYSIQFESADGLFRGTSVQLSGLKVGEVTEVDLNDEGQVLVHFRILKKHANQLKIDSKAVSQRTFVIGEKVIALKGGSSHEEILEPGSRIRGEEAIEITDLLSGGRLSQYFETFELMMGQLKGLALATQNDGQDIAGLYRQMHTTLKSVESLAQDIRMMRRDVIVTNDTKGLIKNLSHSTQDMDKVLLSVAALLPELQRATQEFNGMAPGFAQALQESIVTLQAMQKSFFLRSGVREINEENNKRNNRLPASKSTRP